jgi:hypothetical protein
MPPARASSFRSRAALAASVVLTSTCNFEHPFADESDHRGEGASGKQGTSGVPSDPGHTGGRGSGGDAGAPFTAGADGGSQAGTHSDPGGSGSTESCEDLTSDLCMTVTWPLGIVPYRRDAMVPEGLWPSLRGAVGMWDFLPVWDSQIAFVDDSSPVRPLLHFDMTPGCGVVRRSADALTFALSSCSDLLDITREVGVALGLPRVHQRTDRDRHLDMAEPGQFDCTKGQFFAPCPREAELGVFTTETLLFAPPAPAIPLDACALKPLGSYLYLPKGFAGDPSDGSCEGLFGTREVRSFASDQWALVELYASSRGWTAFRPIGWVPATRWDEGTPAPMVTYRRPVLLTSEEGLLAYALDVDGNRFWRAEYSAEGWSDWHNSESLDSPIEHWTALPVPGSTSFDAFTFSELGLSYARLSNDALVDSFVLGQPPFIGSLDAVRTGDDTLTLFVFSGDAVRVAETDRRGLSDWQTIPGDLFFLTGYGDAAGRGGEQHVVGPALQGGIAYSGRSEVGWSEWTALVPSLGVMTSVAIAMSATGGVDVVGMRAFDGALWHIACSSECSLATSWTHPRLIGGPPTPAGSAGNVTLVETDDHLDLVAMFNDSSTYGGPWHKFLQPSYRH